MLKIENYHKLWRKDIGEWRVGKIDEHEYTYVIRLNKPNGQKMHIMLERNGIGEGESALYELWYWKYIPGTMIGSITNSAASRMMLQLFDIKYMNRLIGSIELLIKK
jgi:hypothetical protein